MNPKLRKDLEFIPLRYEGKTYVLVRDPWELVPEGKLLPLWLFQLLSTLDGSKSKRDLQLAIMQMKGGTLVPLDEIETLIGQLEEDYILDSERLRERIELIKQEYLRREVRDPFNAGRSYPEEKGAFLAYMEGLLETRDRISEEVKAVIAPHIDLRVGKEIYKRTYARLTGTSAREFLILGVGHQMERGIFSLTLKDFRTPLGVIKNYREFTKALMDFEEPLVVEEFYHRTEHSIEFQTLFLHYLVPDQDIRIVPILCGPVSLYLEVPTREAYLDLCGPFIERLKTILSQKPEMVLIAGVDLSHIGPKFGDPYPAHVLEGSTRGHDNQVIKALMERDPELLWDSYRSSGGRFKVCGFSALALLLEILEDVKAELLGYELWHETATQSAVSFVGIVYF